jgi:hypothetical protein
MWGCYASWLLVQSDVVENVKSATREDEAEKTNPEAVRFRQQFTASMPRLHKPVGTNRMSDSGPHKEYECAVTQQ